jgi:hypothetical protein
MKLMYNGIPFEEKNDGIHSVIYYNSKIIGLYYEFEGENSSIHKIFTQIDNHKKNYHFDIELAKEFMKLKTNEPEDLFITTGSYRKAKRTMVHDWFQILVITKPNKK